MKAVLRLALCLVSVCWVASAACSSTSYSPYTCINTAGGFASGNSYTATLSVTAGNPVIVGAQVLTASDTLTASGTGACAGTVNSYSGSANLTGSVGIIVSTTATSTGTCNIIISWSGSSGVLVGTIWQWAGWNGMFDTAGTPQIVSTGSVTSGVTASCPTVTTTEPGDLVLCVIVDSGNNGGSTITGKNGFALVSSNFAIGIIEQVQTSAGAITPQFSYDTTTTFGVATITLVSSAVTPSSHTVGSINGVAVGKAVQQARLINGQYMNPYSGYAGALNGLALPFTATSAQNFIDFSGGTSGAAPSTGTLASSTHGPVGGGWTNSYGAGVTYSNALSLGTLPFPVNVNGTVYSQTGSKGILCQSTNGTVTATYCAAAAFSFTNGGSTSVGYWFQSNCDSGLAIDCGAMGLIAGTVGTDYTLFHINPASPGCPVLGNYNGILFENFGGDPATCLPYTNSSATYRVNAQQNVGQAPFAVTFSNGSAVITGANTLTANQAVQLSTTGTLPTNFAACASTACFVSASGLSGSVFKLALVQGGTPIVAGSAGSGIHTATTQNVMTVCLLNPTSHTLSLVGSLVAPANVTGVQPNLMVVGVNGEGPDVAGYNFYYYGAVVDVNGDISQTACVL